jgi:4-hydroxybenzoate polyprenyltransferase
MIKVSHSVFALPFALGAGALALRAEGGWSWRTVGWIVFCAVCARTAAMAQNRLLDARLDAANPRTASRALPARRVTRAFVLGLVFVASALFVLGARALNCGLAVPPLDAWRSKRVRSWGSISCVRGVSPDHNPAPPTGARS